MNSDNNVDDRIRAAVGRRQPQQQTTEAGEQKRRSLISFIAGVDRRRGQTASRRRPTSFPASLSAAFVFLTGVQDTAPTRTFRPQLDASARLIKKNTA